MPTTKTILPSLTRWVVILFMALFILLGCVCVFLIACAVFVWPTVLARCIDQPLPVGVDTSKLQVVIIATALITAGIAAWVAWALQQLLKIIDTVRDGDPFIEANANRLRRIGWLMVGIQVAGLPLGYIGQLCGAPELSLVDLSATLTVDDHHYNHPLGFPFDRSLSLNGLLAILLIFVLAHVFRQGAAMREDMKGTV